MNIQFTVCILHTIFSLGDTLYLYVTVFIQKMIVSCVSKNELKALILLATTQHHGYFYNRIGLCCLD